MARGRGSRRRRQRSQGLPLGFRIGASIFVFACVGLLAEGVGRVFDPQLPRWQGHDSGQVVMVGHPERLWGMGAGERMNGGTTAMISEKGLREPLPSTPRPSARQRIMITGDSSFFGHGVADDETLAVQLERRMQAQGMDVDVINGAIPGYSTEQSLLLMEQVGWELEPTLVIMGNLWSDNNFDHFRDRDLLATHASLGSGLAQYSAFFRLLAAGINRLRPGAEARIVTWTTSSEFPDVGVRRVPIQDYGQNLDRMVHLARENGAGVAFLGPSNRDTVVQGRLPDHVWAGYFDAQAQVAAHHGTVRIDTLPPFQAAFNDGSSLDDLFLDEMHPTTLGQGLLAQAISDGLTQAGWPDNPLHGVDTPFDPSGLRDHTGGTSDDVNQLSPQSNLFAGARPPDPRQAAAPGEEVLPPGAWMLRGSVGTAAFPVQVTVLDTQGRELGQDTLLDPQQGLRFVVTNGVDRAIVRMEDADGAVWEGVGTPQAATVQPALAMVEPPAPE